MTKRNYKSSRLGNIAAAYGLSLPTLRINIQLRLDRIERSHPDYDILSRKGKTLRLPDEVAVFVKHLGEPEIPHLLFEEKEV
jgi:hypothetical protein